MRAAAAGFEVLVTVDQNLRHQQNLSNLPLAVIVIVVQRNTLAHLLPCVPALLAALNEIVPGKLVEVSATA